MITFIKDRDDILLPWVAGQIPHVGDAASFGPARSVGVATGSGKDDELLAVVVYHEFIPAYQSCMISMAASNARWCTRNIVRVLLGVPFYQYECNRVWTVTPHTSERTIRLNKVLGFKVEGTMREAFGPGIHGVVCGMLRREYDKRYWKHGKEDAFGAGRARSNRGREPAGRGEHPGGHRPGIHEPYEPNHAVRHVNL